MTDEHSLYLLMIIKSFLALLKFSIFLRNLLCRFSEAFWQNALEYSCFFPIHIGIYAKLDNKAAWVGKQINSSSHIWNAQKKQKNNSFSTFYFCEERMKHSFLQGSSSPHSHPSSFIFPPQIHNLRSRIKWFNEKRWWWQEGILSIKEQNHGHVNIQDKTLSATRQAVQGLLRESRNGIWRSDNQWQGDQYRDGGLCCCPSQAKIET